LAWPASPNFKFNTVRPQHMWRECHRHPRISPMQLLKLAYLAAKPPYCRLVLGDAKNSLVTIHDTDDEEVERVRANIRAS
jgi:hypothetical protein